MSGLWSWAQSATERVTAFEPGVVHGINLARFCPVSDEEVADGDGDGHGQGD
jgi:hypothetical protein